MPGGTIWVGDVFDPIWPWQIGLILMIGDSVYLIDRMIEHRTDDFETLGDAFWGSRQIYDQRIAANAAYTAGEHGHWGFGGGFATHRFGQTGSLAFDDGSGCFRGVISWAETGSAGRYYQIDVISFR